MKGGSSEFGAVDMAATPHCPLSGPHQGQQIPRAETGEAGGHETEGRRPSLTPATLWKSGSHRKRRKNKGRKDGVWGAGREDAVNR